MHTAEPTESWCHPVGQSMHVAGSSEPCLYRPAAHFSQFEPYSPALHGWHMVEPLSGAFEPTPQFLQPESLATSANFPAAQSVQLVWPTSFWNLPGMHGLQEGEASANWLNPAGHTRHMVVTGASPVIYRPDAHFTESDRVSAAYWPAAHRMH